TAGRRGAAAPGAARHQGGRQLAGERRVGRDGAAGAAAGEPQPAADAEHGEGDAAEDGSEDDHVATAGLLLGLGAALAGGGGGLAGRALVGVVGGPGVFDHEAVLALRTVDLLADEVGVPNRD